MSTFCRKLVTKSLVGESNKATISFEEPIDLSINAILKF